LYTPLTPGPSPQRDEGGFVPSPFGERVRVRGNV